MLYHHVGEFYESPREVAADSSGNFYLIGSAYDYSDSVCFGNGISFAASGGFRDLYVAKINNNGLALWAKNFGTIHLGGPKYGLNVAKDGKFYLIEPGYLYGFTLQQYDSSGNLI